MSASLDANSVFNLAGASVLLIDSEPMSLDVLGRLVSGFGVKTPQKSSTAERARDLCRKDEFDLIITDTQLADQSGYEFVHWLRRSGVQPNCTAPVLLLSAHTPKSEVLRLRDCGANFTVLKPVNPQILLQRILWMARSPRTFVESDGYIGPDRRFRNLGPPVGEAGRRAGDLSANVGEAKEANMSQADIDSLLPSPMRVSL